MAVTWDEARGRYRVSYYDEFGRRRRRWFKKKGAADQYHANAVLRSSRTASVDTSVKFGTYAEWWLQGLIETKRVRPQTHIRYTQIIRDHFLPLLKDRRLVDCDRPVIKRVLHDLFKKGLERSSIGTMTAILQGMYSAATEDRLFQANPLRGLIKAMRLPTRPKERQGDIKALDEEQLAALLQAAYAYEPRFYVPMCVFAWAGLRQGECIALRWEDLDFEAHTIHVRRTVVRDIGVQEAPKGAERFVDVSEKLAAALLEFRRLRLEDALRTGQPMSPWVFYPELAEGPRVVGYLQVRIYTAARRIGQRIGLSWVSPHTLRHTFATLHLANGDPIQWVQQQLGHRSIQTTMDTYGKWIRMVNRAAADSFAERTGHRVGTGALPTERGVAKVLGFERTYNRKR